LVYWTFLDAIVNSRQPGTRRTKRKPRIRKPVVSTVSTTATDGALRFREIAESISDCVIILDRNLCCIYWNRTSEKLTGIPARDVIGRSLFDIIPDVRGSKLEAACGRVMATGLPERFEARWTLSGRAKVFETGLNPSAEGVIVFARDITERCEVDDAMRASLARLTEAFNASPAVLIISREADGTILEVNDRFPELFGHSIAEAIGRRSDDLNMFTEPAARENLIRKSREQPPQSTLETSIRRKSGEIRLVRLSSDRIPVMGETCLISFIEDITEHKRADDNLRKSEQRLAEAQRIAHLGSWYWNTSTSEAHWSDEFYRILGLEPQSLSPTESAFLERVHPDDRRRFQQTITDARRARRSYRFDLRIIRPDSEVRYLHGETKVEYDPAGDPVIITGTCEDVTDTRQAEEKVREGEERFHILFEQSPVPIGLSRDGKILNVNAAHARLFGYSDPTEMRGMSLLEQVAPRYRDEVIRQLRVHEPGLEGPRSYRAIGVRLDGTEFPFSAEVATIVLADGPATLAFITDLTEN
jgi:PAS domain S-box-containing protein